MIKVRRPRGPKQLREPAAEVAAERTEALRVFRLKKKLKKEFKFGVYRKPYVKEAIEKVFHRKCAYCETFYIVNSPVDVEHFRPKGAVVVEKEKKPGYYWLASEWTNLLPSCIKCNRKNTYLMPNNKRETLGKQNYFPLADEKRRAKRPGQERNEKPLLLNPFDDKPWEHLEFSDDGIVRATLNRRGKPSDKGETSIRIYALCRPELVERRAERAKSILAQIERVKRACANMQKYPNDPDFRSDLRRELAELKTYLDPSREYSEMARQLTETFFASIRGKRMFANI